MSDFKLKKMLFLVFNLFISKVKGFEQHFITGLKQKKFGPLTLSLKVSFYKFAAILKIWNFQVERLFESKLFQWNPTPNWGSVRVASVKISSSWLQVSNLKFGRRIVLSVRLKRFSLWNFRRSKCGELRDSPKGLLNSAETKKKLKPNC